MTEFTADVPGEFKVTMIVDQEEDGRGAAGSHAVGTAVFEAAPLTHTLGGHLVTAMRGTDPDMVVVALSYPDALVVFQTRTGTQQVISLDGTPSGMALWPGTRNAVVNTQVQTQIATHTNVVDLETGTVVETWPVALSGEPPTVSPAGVAYYGAASSVVWVDLATRQKMQAGPPFPIPGFQNAALIVHPAGRRLYALGHDGLPKLYRVELDTDHAPLGVTEFPVQDFQGDNLLFMAGGTRLLVGSKLFSLSDAVAQDVTPLGTLMPVGAQRQNFAFASHSESRGEIAIIHRVQLDSGVVNDRERFDVLTYLDGEYQPHARHVCPWSEHGGTLVVPTCRYVFHVPGVDAYMVLTTASDAGYNWTGWALLPRTP